MYVSMATLTVEAFVIDPYNVHTLITKFISVND